MTDKLGQSSALDCSQALQDEVESSFQYLCILYLSGRIVCMTKTRPKFMREPDTFCFHAFDFLLLIIFADVVKKNFEGRAS